MTFWELIVLLSKDDICHSADRFFILYFLLIISSDSQSLPLPLTLKMK